MTTVKQISDNIQASISASISQSVPLLPKAFINVLAKVLGAVFILLYKRNDFIGLQWFVKTASIKEATFNGETLIPLVEIGRQFGVSDPTESTQAELIVDIPVENQSGSLNSGTQIIGSNNGITYILIGSIDLDAATVQGTFRAVSDQSGGDGSGVQGNLPIGDTSLSFANPLPNVARSVTVVSQSVTGANAEDLDVVYRQRVLDRFQKPPQGGAYSDYELWGEEAAGIINVYPYTGSPGQIDVYSEATVASSGSADGIPTNAQLESVLSIINQNENGLASRRSANAFVNSLPITRTGYDVEIFGIAGVSDLAKLQDDITVAIKEYFLSREPFIHGLSVPPRKDQITRTRVSAIAEDIITSSGGTFSNAAFYEAGATSPISSRVLGEGEKSKAAQVSFL